jgi:hypothetical protein
MARESSKTTARSRVRSVPWTALFYGGLVVGRRVTTLSPRERRRLAILLRESRGLPGRLGAKERAELRRLVAKLDLRGMGRDLTPIVRSARRGRGRR